VDLEKHVLVHGSIARSSKNSDWSPVPKLLATISSPSALHIVCSFASCGTLWDLFCSTETTQTDKSKTCFDEQWLQTDEGGNGTLFPSGSQSTDSDSLFIGAASAPSSSRGLPEDTLVFYIKQLVLALQWLHEEVDIVHRDIKPENILLTDDGRAVICDFGSAARLMKEDGVDVRQQAEPQGTLWPRPRYVSLSDCQTLHGTADYIAPEVLQTYEQILLDSDSSIFPHESEYDSTDNGEKRGYDASVDWWSFGAMCYELLTGLPPFYAPTIDETYGMIVSCEVSISYRDSEVIF
jgi:serine/threonine protein kinase